MKRLALVLALLLLPAVAQAQTVINPRGVAFTVSVDHVLVTSYVIGYFAPGATDPVQQQDLGTGTPAADQTLTFTINTMPLTFGAQYVAKVKAVAGTVSGEWSEPSNFFDRAPGPPSKAIVKK